MLNGLLISNPGLKGLDVLPEKLEEVMMEKMVWACLLKLLQKRLGGIEWCYKRISLIY